MAASSHLVSCPCRPSYRVSRLGVGMRYLRLDLDGLSFGLDIEVYTRSDLDGNMPPCVWVHLIPPNRADQAGSSRSSSRVGHQLMVGAWGATMHMIREPR